jgi:transcriptional regulator with XRE-family HTH domain
MKYIEKQKARELRKEQGLSLNEIAKQLGVAKSSVSTWVRDIELTPEQHKKLREKNPIYNNQLNGQKVKREQFLALRKQYQEDGRIKARENNDLFLKGCMLYWAEGSKDKNSVIFSNSDVDMNILFVSFLRESFDVPNDKIKIAINCYLNNDLTQEEVEDYWLSKLELTKGCLNKTIINKLPSSSKGYKKNKHPYGICKIIIHNTEILQNIYGAIKEFANITDDRWLF